MNLYLVTPLRIIHVLASRFWFGIAPYNAGFMQPAIRATGPAVGHTVPLT